MAHEVTVQLDMDTFQNMEEMIEDHELARRMADQEGDEILDIGEARKYYAALEKAE
uniref:Uncharacterized protein n=1 Tax=Candidatus Kentrum sp. UNK TaxID=2126344 RepID=A0A451B254_9GAMM|nr:MAG: hypothetical protein BECKUNK1418G_GA0071005_103329 [Candidatus Kentron sp. UNK]VFK72361.1 MAG: hypothetical protein BECKUNK1418H_GA0071006_111010 [Candidatus Kentron sp. UNK]